ncbi:hypothetical protein [Aeromonas enteropelogenes]|uniref:hypothetical protein n=1 Tax=Aeromonas enteropelogenes TaxID=29489 RepID=UPI003F74ABB4
MNATAQVIALVQQPSAADVALAEMRARFGRNGAASRWSRLPVHARAIVCYAAGISTRLAGQELDQFDFDQQEAIRLALGNLLAMLREFDGSVLHRREWHRTTRRIEGPTRSELEQAAFENQRRAELNAQASVLENRIAVARRVVGNGQ